MKIAIFSPWAISEEFIGGTERFVMDLATALKKRGQEVSVFTFSGSGKDIGGVEYRSLNLFGRDKVANEEDLANKFSFREIADYETFAVNLMSIVDIDRFDVLISNSQLLLKAWTSKKRLFVIHANPFEFKHEWGKDAYKTMLGIMAQTTHTRFVAPSEYYAALYSEQTGVDIAPIPHAIDERRLAPRAPKEHLRRLYALDSGLTTILVPGRLESAQKRPALALEALLLLEKGRRDEYQILFSGLDSHYTNEASRLLETASSGGLRISIRNFLSMADAYSVSDLVILPSQSESFGYTALESLSLGIPTIMNEIPTYKEIAAGADNVFYFDGDSASLAEVMFNLPKSPGRLRQPAAWRRRFQIDSWAGKYVNLLED